MTHHPTEENYDFSGYATVANQRCSDGRTIAKDAFAHHDGTTVPLVWQHLHDSPTNVLGHALLRAKEKGIYTYCSFNNTPEAQAAKESVRHGDVVSLSIYANQLVEKSKNVLHGMIREVSLVLTGANPGALIDNIAISHGDEGLIEDETSAVIYSGEEVMIHSNKTSPVEELPGDPTLEEVFKTLNEQQKELVYAIAGQMLQESTADATGNITHSEEGESNSMKTNVFEPTEEEVKKQAALAHSADLFSPTSLNTMIALAKQSSGSLRDAFMAHAGTYGINDISYLFPDPKVVGEVPALIKRRTAWVDKVYGGAKKSPFSRIKTLAADLTPDEARGRGYVTGKKKVDEVIGLLKRVTMPQTVYKKQRLDRDDILDITDFDVVSWLKGEMRMMMDEELARAVLVGDGRPSGSDDKIKQDNIRSIYGDDSLYAVRVVLAAGTTTSQVIDEIVMAREQYHGSGSPTFFTTTNMVSTMLLLKDSTGRRIYNTISELASALRVTEIVEVPVMANILRVVTADTTDARLLGIVVDMNDYTIGADKGGQLSFFEQFDIDYNQQKYLIEARVCGALTLPHSALVVEKLEPHVAG